MSVKKLNLGEFSAKCKQNRCTNPEQHQTEMTDRNLIKAESQRNKQNAMMTDGKS
jgi:hypothetical protein